MYEAHDDVMCKVPKPWPSVSDMEDLLLMCSGLFVVASCVSAFIDDESGIPSDQLQIVLNDRVQSSSVYGNLDRLYKEILHRPPSNMKDCVQLVLGTIVFLAEPLSLKGLECLFRTQIRIGHIRLALRWLRSILFIPDDEGNPIQIFHESLRDFFTDKRRSGDYFLDPSVYHTNVARLCLSLMSVSMSSTSTYVIDMSTYAWSDSMGGAVVYACRHWAFHLAHSSPQVDVANSIKGFEISAWLCALNVFETHRYSKYYLETAIRWLEVSYYIHCILPAYKLFKCLPLCSICLSLLLCMSRLCNASLMMSS
jgi:hypothetical protein